LRQTSADVLCFKQYRTIIWQSCDFGSHTPQYMAVNTQSSLYWLIGNPSTAGNPCNLQLYSAGFLLSITILLAATYSILIWS
jgi:hypothetical protein